MGIWFKKGFENVKKFHPTDGRMVRRTDGRTDIPTGKDEQSDILVVCTQIAKWTDMDGRTMRHTGGLYTDSKMDWKKNS